MLALARYAFCAVALLAITASVLAQSTATNQTPTGTITGRVTINGQPAPGVTLSLQPSSSSPPSVPPPLLKAKTNSDGRYQFTGLSAGEYVVAPFPAAFVPLPRESPGQTGKTLTLAEGETAEEIDFTLTRGAVITGRVTDAQKRPVIGEVVRLIPMTEDGHQLASAISPTGTLPDWETDDRGIYRLYGLPAGHYRVKVGTSSDSLRLSGPRSFYPVTFYPNVTDEAQAKIVELAEGSEATEVNITLGRAEQAYDVSGRIVEDETGQPVAKVMFGYGRTGNGNSSFSYGPRSDEKGHFHLAGILPGSYALALRPYTNSEFYSLPVPFEVTDADITGLEIKVYRGGSISGEIVIEGNDDPAVRALFSKMQIQTHPLFLGQRVLESLVRIVSPGLDGSFRVGGVAPGKAIFTTSAPPQGFRFMRLEHNGVTQRSGMIDIEPGEQVTGARLVFYQVPTGTGIISGQVEIIGGPLPPGILPRLLVRRVDAPNLPSIPLNQIDSRGRFVIDGLAPGEYEVLFVTIERPVATAPGMPPEMPAPLPPIPNNKRIVTVANGVESKVSFVLDLSKKEK